MPIHATWCLKNNETNAINLMAVEKGCENILNTIHIGYQTFIKLANIHYKSIQGHTETISFELFVNLSISGTPLLSNLILINVDIC